MFSLGKLLAIWPYLLSATTNVDDSGNQHKDELPYRPSIAKTHEGALRFRTFAPTAVQGAHGSHARESSAKPLKSHGLEDFPGIQEALRVKHGLQLALPL